MSRIGLTRFRRWSIYGIGVGLWASGVLWLVAHYRWTRAGEFGPETSPAEPWGLKLHGGFAMAALWLAGLLWGVHVVNGWRAHRKRWSGALLLGLLLFLAVTGYLLYYLGDEDLRGWTSVAHWVVGLLLPASFIWHRLARVR